MKANAPNPRDKYIKVLALDNFIQALTEEQRMQITLYRLGRTEQIPAIANKLMQWIELNRWQPPATKYNEDREMVWHNARNDKWCKMNEYYLWQAEVILE